MTKDRRGPWTPAAPGELGLTVIAAVLAVIGFRVGALPGGLVGADVVLAALGWWFASGGNGFAGVRGRAATAWSVIWPPVLAAIALAAAWVAVSSSTRLDVVVRGEALAALGGYSNWHQISLGPVEDLANRVQSPLQQMWLVAVAVQCLLVWLLLVAATRGRAARHPDRADPVVFGGLVLAGLGTVAGLVLLVTDASGQALLIATPVRAVSFLLGAVAGAAGDSKVGRTMHTKAHGARWAGVAALAVVAVVGAPDSDLGRLAAVLLVPFVAAVVVIAVVPRAVTTDAAPSAFGEVEWSLVVAACVLVTPSIALVRAAMPDASAWIVGPLGLMLATAAVCGVVWLASARSMEPAAIERRRVLLPPLVLVLLVVLFSLTGAFHWAAPETIEQWEASR